MNVTAVKPMSFSESRQEKLQKIARYYETRENYKIDPQKIEKQKKRARVLIGTCVGGGFVGIITYTIIKLLRHKII